MKKTIVLSIILGGCTTIEKPKPLWKAPPKSSYKVTIVKKRDENGIVFSKCYFTQNSYLGCFSDYFGYLRKLKAFKNAQEAKRTLHNKNKRFNYDRQEKNEGLYNKNKINKGVA